MGRLFWKFFLSILLAQIAATVAIGGAIWLKNHSGAQQRRLDIDMGPPAEIAIESAAATLDAGGPAALARLLDTMGRHRVFAVDGTGKELLGRIVDPSMLAEARALLHKGDVRVVRNVTMPDGRQFLLFLPARQHQGGLDARDTAPLLAGAGLAGLGGRRPGGPPPDADRPRGGEPGMRGPGSPPDPERRFRPLTPFIPLAAAVLASLLFAALLAWYFARPIRSLRLAFEAASHGDLAPRFAHVGIGGDELSDLGRDFDRMTARLRSLMDGQTRLLHDVSHELRSPLARLQAAIGLAHQKPERMAASLERIERESIRMDKLVGELLTLSRLEAGALAANRQEVDMAELMEHIVADAQFEAAAQGRSVVQQGEADVTLLGEPDLLARAIENVVRNAIKHSPEDGMILVEVRTAGARLYVRVLDRGPGVAPADLATIFQPFFRSSDTEKDVDGHGLGLAIAQQVVQQHGGTIAASNRADGGLCVEIVLPLD